MLLSCNNSLIFCAINMVIVQMIILIYGDCHKDFVDEYGPDCVEEKNDEDNEIVVVLHSVVNFLYFHLNFCFI